MRRIIGPVFAAAAFLVPHHGLAQTPGTAILTHLHGDVLVDVGQGFVPAAADVRLRVGDRVMVTKAGGAVLSYGEGCAFPLASPSMTTVEETACTTTTQGESGNSGGVAAASGLSVVTTLGAAAAGMTEDDELPVSP